jgi:hypothetical protein
MPSKKKLRKIKKKEKAIRELSKEERHKIITKEMIGLSMYDMTHVLKQKHKDRIQEYIDTGKEYEKEIWLPVNSETLIIKLYNTTKNESGFSMRMERIMGDDE